MRTRAGQHRLWRAGQGPVVPFRPMQGVATRPSRATVVAVLSLALALGAGGRAGASARVVLLDVGVVDTATPELDEVADQLVARGIQALGPAVAGAWPTDEPPLPSSPEVDALLAEAERLLEDFDSEGAMGALQRAADLVADGADGEHGAALLVIHWMFADLAMAEGQEAVCLAHLRQIVRAAPWWEPPRGYLTPDVAEAFTRERDAAAAIAATLDLESLPTGTAVHVDGIDVTGATRLPVLPGLHLLRVQRPGQATWRRWTDVAGGQVMVVAPPATPAWTDEVRATARAALDAGDSAAMHSLTAGIIADTGASVVVLAQPGRRDDAVVAAGIMAGRDGWVVEPGAYTAASLAEAIRDVRLPRERTTSPAVAGVLAVDAGGTARIVLPEDRLVAAGSGPAIEAGGGLLLGGVLELRALAGLHHFGAAPMSLEGSGVVLEGSQQATLLRFGAAVSPRIRLGSATHLWIGAGGGVALAWSTTELDGWGRTSHTGSGGYLYVGLGLDVAASRAVGLGPSGGLVIAGVPQETALTDIPPLLTVTSGAVRSLQFGLRGTFGPGR